MTFDWFRAWNQRFTHEDRGGRRPNVLVLKKHGVIAGIAPFIYRIASRFGVAARKLESVGRWPTMSTLLWETTWLVRAEQLQISSWKDKTSGT